MRISELAGQRVAVWGYGREGRATLMALRKRLPDQALTLLCNVEEAIEAQALHDPLLSIVAIGIDADCLSRFDIVVKSPGISPYREPAAAALAQGVRFTSGTALWFAENPQARTICVTGSKGKSTTTALIAHLLRAGGHRTALAGNIGLPLLELLDVEPAPELWAIELSSYQTRDAIAPDVAVVLNLFPEHLDWHGSEARYYADKLALATESGARQIVLNAGDATLRALTPSKNTRVHLFNGASGWHARGGWLRRGDENVLPLADLPLPGAHNHGNLCAALAAIDALSLDARMLAPHARTFRTLPHRLQSLGVRDGIEYVNDSISTAPQAAIAALEFFRDRRVAVIVGGYDRGLDWGVFAEYVSRQPPVAVITQGQNGARIAERLRQLAHVSGFALHHAENLEDAVTLARQSLTGGGAILLSPGAPSFPRYRDYAERGRHFAALAGFDPDVITAIAGLGVA